MKGGDTRGAKEKIQPESMVGYPLTNTQKHVTTL